jgi:hypothetical protein
VAVQVESGPGLTVLSDLVIIIYFLSSRPFLEIGEESVVRDKSGMVTRKLLLFFSLSYMSKYGKRQFSPRSLYKSPSQPLLV